MAGDDFDIDDILLTKRSAAPALKVDESANVAKKTETKDFPLPAPRVQIIVDEDEEEEKKPLPAPVMPPVEQKEVKISFKQKTALFPVQSITPSPELKVVQPQAAKPPVRKKSKDSFSQAAIPNVTAPAVKHRNYALGCCIFAFIIPLFIGAAAAAAVRYWKPIRVQMERLDAWMAAHGLSYDGGDAPWKHKKEEGGNLDKLKKNVSEKNSSADSHTAH